METVNKGTGKHSLSTLNVELWILCSSNSNTIMKENTSLRPFQNISRIKYKYFRTVTYFRFDTAATLNSTNKRI